MVLSKYLTCIGILSLIYLLQKCKVEVSSWLQFFLLFESKFNLMNV